MTKYKRESHLRSLIKGISWRVLATTDTIFVVLLITCLSSNCSIENAIKIGAIEFVLKLIAYYFHERIWQNILVDKIVTPKITLKKTVSWRIIATVMTFIISGSVLEVFDEIAIYIAVTELFTKFALYYLHERFWLKLPLGKVRNFFSNKKK